MPDVLFLLTLVCAGKNLFQVPLAFAIACVNEFQQQVSSLTTVVLSPPLVLKGFVYETSTTTTVSW
jgi:hypothetical protein